MSIFGLRPSRMLASLALSGMVAAVTTFAGASPAAATVDLMECRGWKPIEGIAYAKARICLMRTTVADPYVRSIRKAQTWVEAVREGGSGFENVFIPELNVFIYDTGGSPIQAYSVSCGWTTLTSGLQRLCDTGSFTSSTFLPLRSEADIWANFGPDGHDTTPLVSTWVGMQVNP